MYVCKIENFVPTQLIHKTVIAFAFCDCECQ